MIDPYIPDSPGGEMKCPYCGENTPDAWEKLIVDTPSWETIASFTSQVRLADMCNKQLNAPDTHAVTVDWMFCAAEKCQQLVLRVHESYFARGRSRNDPLAYVQTTDTWFARPKYPKVRPFPIGVPEEFRQDYEEAAVLLEVSPRMSAVLSRRMLGDLLERYAKIDDKRLTKQIDLFTADVSHPRRIREGLHHFREAGDFAAHTQTNERSGEIIDVGHDEAEWTLDRVDALFEYFILDPAKDQQMFAAMDKKIADAGRKELSPLPEDPEIPSQ